MIADSIDRRRCDGRRFAQPWWNGRIDDRRRNRANQRCQSWTHETHLRCCLSGQSNVLATAWTHSEKLSNSRSTSDRCANDCVRTIDRYYLCHSHWDRPRHRRSYFLSISTIRTTNRITKIDADLLLAEHGHIHHGDNEASTPTLGLPRQHHRSILRKSLRIIVHRSSPRCVVGDIYWRIRGMGDHFCDCESRHSFVVASSSSRIRMQLRQSCPTFAQIDRLIASTVARLSRCLPSRSQQGYSEQDCRDRAAYFPLCRTYRPRRTASLPLTRYNVQALGYDHGDYFDELAKNNAETFRSQWSPTCSSSRSLSCWEHHNSLVSISVFLSRSLC